MEFWGTDAVADTQAPVYPTEGQLVHITQAALGFQEDVDMESVKNVVVWVSVDGKDIVLGRLSGRTSQLILNQVLNKRSFLSHNWKDGRVHFSGYTFEEKVDENDKQQMKKTRLIGDGLYPRAGGDNISVQEAPSQLAQVSQNPGAFGNFGQTQAGSTTLVQQTQGMDFWGTKAVANIPAPVFPTDGQLVHVTQAALGFEDVDMESVKNVVVWVSVNGTKIVLGRLSGKTSQIILDQVLDKGSFLLHNWKDGSVHFSGYTFDENVDENGKQQMKKTRLIGDGLYPRAGTDNIIVQKGPSQLAQLSQNAGAFGNFGQTQAAGLSGFGGPAGIFCQSNYGQLSVAQKTAGVQAPVSNPFGTLPAVPLMPTLQCPAAVGPAGTSPSIQYGVSSLPKYNLSADTVLEKTKPLPEKKEAVVGKRKKKTGENQPVEAPEEKTEKKMKKKAVAAADSVLPEAEDAGKQEKKKKRSSADTILGKTEPLPGVKEEVVGKRKKKTEETQPEEKKAKKTKRTAVDSDDTALAEAEAEDAGKLAKKKKCKHSAEELDSLDTEVRETGEKKKKKKRKHAALVEDTETPSKKKDKQKRKRSVE